MLIYNVGNYAVFPLDNDDEPLSQPSLVARRDKEEGLGFVLELSCYFIYI